MYPIELAMACVVYAYFIILSVVNYIILPAVKLMTLSVSQYMYPIELA